MTFNNDLTVAYNRNVIVKAPASIYITYPFSNSGTQTVYPMLLRNYSAYLNEDSGAFEPSPTPTPIVTPIPTSGGGSGGSYPTPIDYTNHLNTINNSINNSSQNIIDNQDDNTDRIIDNQNQNTQIIANTISGEVEKINNTLTDVPDISNTQITSGDIEGALGFTFMADPYANFWFEMTNGLRGSLTGSVRQLPIDWLGYQGVFDLDSLGFNYPASIRLILTSVSTVSMVWLLVKWWKIIIDKLTSGDMDEVLAMNEEERHRRYVLGGCKYD